jgi:NADH-quinone oxidoreductase subunit M
MKKLIAYTSVSHLGFVVLGIFSFTQAGLNGAMFVMLAHGISTSGLFMLTGILHERRHTYEISEFGGLASPMPLYAASFLLMALASAGLPLLNGFIGEFLVLNGAFQDKAIYGILGATGIIWSAVYLLWMYQRVFYGEVTHPVNNSIGDLSGFEKASVWPCAAAAVVMGVAPILWLGAIDPAAHAALTSFAQVASGVVGR